MSEEENKLKMIVSLKKGSHHANLPIPYIKSFLIIAEIFKCLEGIFVIDFL